MIDQIAVLVVEDEALIRMDVVDQLEDEGFVAFEAANADEAIAHLEAQPQIRILFTDIDMPGSMDGLRLAAAQHVMIDRHFNGHNVESTCSVPSAREDKQLT